MCDTQLLQKGWFPWCVTKGTEVKPKQWKMKSMTVDEKYYSWVVLELTPPGPQIPVGRTSRMGVSERWMGAYRTREATQV